MPSETAPGPLGILLVDGTHERAHYAFVLAAGAASLGREVVLFATNHGCRALMADWSDLDQVGRDAVVRARGVAGIGELREAARDLGVRMIACEAGMRAEGLDSAHLLPGVEMAGVATFLSSVKGGDLVSL